MDVTDEIACLGVFGPKSRSLMSKLSNDDFSNENFKFGTSKAIKINNKKNMGTKIILRRRN